MTKTTLITPKREKLEKAAPIIGRKLQGPVAALLKAREAHRQRMSIVNPIVDQVWGSKPRYAAKTRGEGVGELLTIPSLGYLMSDEEFDAYQAELFAAYQAAGIAGETPDDSVTWPTQRAVIEAETRILDILEPIVGGRPVGLKDRERLIEGAIRIVGLSD